MIATEVDVLVRYSRIALLGAALAAGVVLPALASESSTAEPAQMKFETAAAQLEPTAGKDGPEANALTSGSSIAPLAAKRQSPRGSGRLIGRRLNSSAYARRPVAPSLILGVRF
jgi:hypothetical protein